MSRSVALSVRDDEPVMESLFAVVRELLWQEVHAVADDVFDGAATWAAPVSAPVAHDRTDLLGGYPAPRRYIGWQTFFDLGDSQVKANEKIDTTISSVLFTLPLPAIAPPMQTSPTVLPRRNPAAPAHLGHPLRAGHRPRDARSRPRRQRTVGHRLHRQAVRHQHPLWYYILAEAEHMTGGLKLGPVGGPPTPRLAGT